MKTSIKLIASILLAGFLSPTAHSQTFLNETFEGAMDPSTNLPASWTETGLSTDGIYSTGTSTTTNQGGYFPIPAHGTFAYSDDDDCNCNKSADRLILPTLNFAAVAANAILKFDASVYHPSLTGETFTLQASTDGGATWTNVQTIPMSTSWQNLSYNVSTYIGNANVKFAFLYNDLGTFGGGVAVDDVLIYLQPAVDQQLISASFGEYTIVPLRQVGTGFPVSATVKNNGTAVLNTSLITANVFLSTNLTTPVSTLTYSIPTLVPNATATYQMGNFIPTAAGTYLLRVTGNVAGDAFMNNDTTYTTITITNSTMARDRGTSSSGIGSNSGSTANIGTLFTITSVSKLDSVMYFIAPSVVGTGVKVSVSSYVNGAVTLTPIGTSVIYNSVAADATGKVLNLKVTNMSGGDLILQPGTYYIGLEKPNSTHGNYALQSDANIYTDNTVLCSLNGAAFVPLTNLVTGGFLYTPILRPLFKCAISTSHLSSNIACVGGFGTANIYVNNAIQPVNYVWSNNSSTGSSSTNLSAGTYTVTATDATGCTSAQTFTITENLNPMTITDTKQDILCHGGQTGSITLSVSGGTPSYSYTWTNSPATTASLSNVGAGTYQVTVSDIAGCSSTHSVTLTEPTPIAITGTSTNSTFGNTNGTVSISATGGTAPYTYLWNTMATTDNLSNLSAGTYVVEVTDANGCVSTSSFVVEQELSIDQLASGTYTLYPNPSNGLMTFELKNVPASDLFISVCDLSGKNVFTEGTQSNTNTFQKQIDLSHLTNGQYILKIQTSTGVIIEKITIQ